MIVLVWEVDVDDFEEFGLLLYDGGMEEFF